ncbi:unnamed protein product [Moneuplotes crassus]|uniref:Uncharacterized protein n=1 Tax=Euplotes crassus TaxID=5936 RepID=A0AAD2CZU0_EUPCR|nr:unnamed protein product [Moneuplotes crassus]
MNKFGQNGFFNSINRRRFRPSASDLMDDSHKGGLGVLQLLKEETKDEPEEQESSIISTGTFSNQKSNFRSILKPIDLDEDKKSLLSKVRLEDLKDDSDYGCIIALTENRAREIGFACISLRDFSIELTQISDSQTYIHTLTVLHNYNPTEIIIPHTLQESGLCLKIKDEIESYENVLKFIQRKLFNEENGIRIFEDSTADRPFIDFDKKYIAMASLSGLFNYCESQSIVLDSKCLNVKLISENERMNLDFMTYQNLELTYNLKYLNNKYTLASLFHCETEAGSKITINNILNPLKSVKSIQKRQEVVSELKTKAIYRSEVKSILSQFKKFDIYIGRIFSCKHSFHRNKPNDSDTAVLMSEYDIRTMLSNIIKFYSFLSQIQKFTEIIKKGESEMLQEMGVSIDDRKIDTIILVIQKYLVVKTNSLSKFNQKGKKFDKSNEPQILPKNNIQQIGCIKKGVNDFIDLCKESYSDTMNKIQRLTIRLQRTLLKNIKLGYNKTLGYHFTCKKEDYEDKISQKKAKEHSIVVLGRLKHAIRFRTKELLKYNLKLKEYENEILYLTQEIVIEILVVIKQNISSLFNVANTVATVDMLLAFALFSIEQGMTTQPVILDEHQEDQPLLYIEKGRNAFFHEENISVANDVSLTKYESTMILTGINGSGKTFYLKMMAVNTILAQIGCNVPAVSMILRPFDNLYLRMSARDSMLKSESSSDSERKQMKYIVDYAVSNSLILLDEVGNLQNYDITLTTTDLFKLLSRPSTLICISTHFPNIPSLSLYYPTIVNKHLESLFNEETGKIKCTHRVKDGVNQSCFNYGIAMCLFRKILFSVDIIEIAFLTLKKLDDVFHMSINKNKPEEMSKTFCESTEKANHLLKSLYGLKLESISRLTKAKRLNDEEGYRKIEAEEVAQFDQKVKELCEQNNFVQ